MVFLLRSKKKLRPKTRKCKQCKKKVPVDSVYQKGLLAFCCVEHLIAYSKSPPGKTAVRKAHRDMKDHVKPMSQLKKEAQTAVNSWIRYRDKDLPCISCGTFGSGDKYGGAWDAGHYKTVGAHPELRYNVLNIHKQCKACNSWRSGHVVEYRQGLIDKIGLDAVERLEKQHPPAKYTSDYLIRIKRIFQKRLRIRKKITK